MYKIPRMSNIEYIKDYLRVMEGFKYILVTESLAFDLCQGNVFIYISIWEVQKSKFLQLFLLCPLEDSTSAFLIQCYYLEGMGGRETLRGFHCPSELCVFIMLWAEAAHPSMFHIPPHLKMQLRYSHIMRTVYCQIPL